MKEALQRLDSLTAREGQVTATETLVAVQSVLEKVGRLESGVSTVLGMYPKYLTKLARWKLAKQKGCFSIR